MYNPSYLIQSRHNVFYFRYPLPAKAFGKEARISISLRTRCPKEALRLAKALEYHSCNLIAGMDFEQMDHAEVMAMMKSYYAEALERLKGRIDRDGPLPKENIQNFQNSLREWEEIIEAGVNDLPELIGAEYETPEDDPMKEDLRKIMDHNGQSFSPDSQEYGMMKIAYKHVKRSYH